MLKVISRSTFDLQPVLDTVAETAARLCDADQAAIYRREGESARLVANYGFPPEYETYTRALGAFPIDPNAAAVGQRTLVEGRPVHVHDVAAVPGYWEIAITLGKQRTSLGVPLLREGETIGNIMLARQRVEPFTDRQIDLVSTFADQAVIAIENTRLINEQREALEQQTATAEVLQVINASPGNLAPVFDAMLEKALRLCDAAFGNLWTYDGEVGRLAAIRGASPEYRAELTRAGPQKPESGNSLKRLVEGEPLVHIADITAEDAHRSGAAVRRMLADRASARTVLWVPLRKDGALLGFFTIYRTEVRRFTDKQIALLQNFAAQAVIAMENARLITEQREALEQQTATAEVLQVINASAGDLERVFDTILEKAILLCESSFGGLSTYDGEYFRVVATRGMSPGLAKALRERGPLQPSKSIAYDQIVRGADIVHIADIADLGVPFPSSPNIDQDGARTTLFVALRGDDALFGAFVIFRKEVRPFSDKQIALLKNFAAQAVIAMENARLINEEREALEQQTATADVLRVINNFPGKLTPVFETILEKAHSVCDATMGSLALFNGDVLHGVVERGMSAVSVAALRQPRTPRPGGPAERFRRGERFVQFPDLRVVQDSLSQTIATKDGVRTVLFVPLRKDTTLLGWITAYRTEPKPFTPKHMSLLESFAAQAVIAMENARLLTEQQEALEQQTATAEVLQVINASPGNLMPVFNAILEKAHSLCGAAKGAFITSDGEQFPVAATRGLSDAYIAVLRNYSYRQAKAGYTVDELSPREQLLNGADLVHLTGPAVAVGPIGRAVVEIEKIRTILFVPLRRDGTLLGYITAYREEESLFSEKQIAVLQNFASQAVIAMENARLLTEQREALEQQTATAEVLQVINASPGDLAPVFDAMLDRAMRLCDGAQGTLWMFDGERMSASATAGYSSELAEQLSEWREIHPFQRRLSQGERVFQIVDLAAEDLYHSGNPLTRAAVDVAGIRTVVFVALVKDATTLGGFTIGRREVRAFTDKHIALLQNFAEQAVIAMENARLITEQREALEQQTATAEVLQVINASPGDLAPVFDAILEKAMRLCDARLADIATFDGERFTPVALRGVPPAYADYRMHNQPCDRARDANWSHPPWSETFVQITDMTMEEAYLNGNPDRRALVDIGGARTSLAVALRKDETLLGMIQCLSPGGPSIYRQADRTAGELRRPGGDRDGERAADDRAAGGTGAADRDGGSIAGDQRLAWRSGAGVRGDARKGDAPLRRHLWPFSYL